MADLCTMLFLVATYTLVQDQKDYSKGQASCYILMMLGIGFLMLMLVYQLILSIINFVRIVREHYKKKKEIEEKERQ